MNDGTSAGLAYLAGRNLELSRQKSAAHAQQLQELRQKRQQLISDGLYDLAFAKAHADVASEIVRELAREAAGDKHARRLSDPRNVAGRNQALAERATAHLHRLGKGTLKSVEAEISRLMAKYPLK